MSGAKPQIGGRIPHDVHEDFEEFRKENNLSKSDALRRLVESGLEGQQKGGSTNEAMGSPAVLAGMGEALALALVLLLPVYLLTDTLSVGLMASFAVLTIVVNLEAVVYQYTGTGLRGAVSRFLREETDA